MRGLSDWRTDELADARRLPATQFLEEAGIAPHDVTPWNTYPCYINRAPKAAELQAGAKVLEQLRRTGARRLRPRLVGGAAALCRAGGRSGGDDAFAADGARYGPGAQPGE